MSEQNLMESTDHGTTSVVPPVKRNRGRGGKPQFGLTGASMLVVMTIARCIFLPRCGGFSSRPQKATVGCTQAIHSGSMTSVLRKISLKSSTATEASTSAGCETPSSTRSSPGWVPD